MATVPGPRRTLAQVTRRRDEWRPIDVSNVNALLGIHVADVEPYRLALRHRSAGAGSPPGRDNGRLEFMGDPVINLVAARYLYDKFPDASAGELSMRRARLVSGKALAGFATALGLGRHIELGPAVLDLTPAIMEDAFEALVGAMYFDQGPEVASTFFLDCMRRFVCWDDVLEQANYKQLLQHEAQAKRVELPKYISEPHRIDEGTGGYLVTLDFMGIRGEGIGRRKKEAEMEAAKVVYQKMTQAHRPDRPEVTALARDAAGAGGQRGRDVIGAVGTVSGLL